MEEENRRCRRSDPTRALRALTAVLLAVATVLWPVRSLAQVRPQRHETAAPATGTYVDHLKAAARAARDGNWRLAAAEYAAANSIAPGPETLAGMANAAYELRSWGEAYDLYQRYLSLATSSIGAQARAAIEARIRELEARTGELVITVIEPDATISLDNGVLATSPIQKGIRIDVGRHVVKVTKPGFVPVERAVDISSRASVTVEIAKMSPIGEAPARRPEEGPAKPPADGDAQAPAMLSPHGSRSYKPLRVTTAPRIDGRLDEEIWARAPKDDHFQSSVSTPYGKPSTEPTIVQVAYDEDNVYVAFRCRYSGPGPRDDTIVTDEMLIGAESEAVGVSIDGRHDHNSAKDFWVTRRGDRVDSDRTNDGLVENFNWRGIWDVATQAGPDSWTAEFAIPWSTVDVRPSTKTFDIGINFVRQVILANETAFWVLPPPEAPLPPSGFGHLVSLQKSKPPALLYLQPYVVGFVQDPSEAVPRLRDFAGLADPLGGGVYGGLYARVQTSSAFQLDATFNPDFSQVTPDQALSNLSRFELLRPELRPFFAEGLNNFKFGFGEDGDSTQLFYTRRIGLTEAGNAYREVPILFGTKGVSRPMTGSTVSAMVIGQSNDPASSALGNTVGVVRYNQVFDGGSRVGNMMLVRQGRGGDSYLLQGVDGSVNLLDQRLRFTGFAATTSTAGQENSSRNGAIGGAAIAWRSRELIQQVRVVEVGNSFDPSLGFIREGVGTRTASFDSMYTPRLNSDYIQRLGFSFGAARARLSSPDQQLYDNINIGLIGFFVDGGEVSVTLGASSENITQPFVRAGGRFLVQQGKYNPYYASFSVRTAMGRTVSGWANYTEGDLYSGYQRRPGVGGALTLGPFTDSVSIDIPVLYTAPEPTRPSSTISGIIVSNRALLRYSPRARSALAVEANTLDPRSVVQFVTSYTFGPLSTIALVLSQTALSVDAALTTAADRRAIISFAYGFMPF